MLKFMSQRNANQHKPTQCLPIAARMVWGQWDLVGLYTRSRTRGGCRAGDSEHQETWLSSTRRNPGDITLCYQSTVFLRNRHPITSTSNFHVISTDLSGICAHATAGGHREEQTGPMERERAAFPLPHNSDLPTG